MSLETFKKKEWLNDTTIQRRYVDCEQRDPSAYLTNRQNASNFPFIHQAIKREAQRITRGASSLTSKTKSAKIIARARQKSAMSRKVILTEIIDSVERLTRDETVLLFNFMFDGLDKRLLYFMAVYLTSKKYIDFITLLFRVFITLTVTSSFTYFFFYV